MRNLDMLLGNTGGQLQNNIHSTANYRKATVVEVTPLRIHLDGDPGPLSIPPDRLGTAAVTAVGQRVLVLVLGRQLIVVGVLGESAVGELPVLPRYDKTVNVLEYGAVGNGTGDQTDAFRRAVEATPSGGTLIVPAGVYTRPYATPTSEDDYIVIDKPMTIQGDGTLENFLFYVKGSVDVPKSLGAAATEGDNAITVNDHGWSVGQYVQVQSQYNVYTTAASFYQLGSINPTSGSLPDCRTGEIHRIGKVVGDVLSFDDLLTFGNYNASATVRRINPVSNVTFEGLTFRNTTASSYRGILVRYAANFVVRNCWFVSSSPAGSSLKVFDSINTVIEGGGVIKYVDSISGSSWNSILIGGGCTNTTISNIYCEGGAQTIDFTPSLADFAADPGGESGYRTCQGMVVRDSVFKNCSDAFTTHPGTWDLTVTGCSIYGGSTGMRIRSGRSTIIGNNISTSRTGIALSAFVHDSTISANSINHVLSSSYDDYFIGIGYSSLSSEIDNNNNIRNLVIVGNTIVVQTGTYTNNWAMDFGASNIEGYTLSDVWRKRSSQIYVNGNVIRGGSLRFDETTNAPRIIGNTFYGTTDASHKVVIKGVASVVTQNVFLDSSGSISTDTAPYADYGYTTLNRIGNNIYHYTPNNALNNHTTMVVQ